MKLERTGDMNENQVVITTMKEMVWGYDENDDVGDTTIFIMNKIQIVAEECRYCQKSKRSVGV